MSTNSTTPTRPAPSIEAARVALGEARLLRSEWLLVLNAGALTPLALFQEAQTPAGRPLRAVRLRQVLLTQEGWTPAKAKAALELLASAVTKVTPTRSLTVGWLVDNRTGNRRIEEWISMVSVSRSVPVWDRFPWAKEPSRD